MNQSQRTTEKNSNNFESYFMFVLGKFQTSIMERNVFKFWYESKRDFFTKRWHLCVCVHVQWMKANKITSELVEIRWCLPKLVHSWVKQINMLVEPFMFLQMWRWSASIYFDHRLRFHIFFSSLFFPFRPFSIKNNKTKASLI